jgi:ATP-binding cassette subfamily B protein
MLESNHFMDLLNTQTFPDGTRQDFIINGEIVFEEITFRYDKNLPYIFTNFSLVIPARTSILLMGDSGSGKTTLLRLLLGFFILEKGVIRIDGVDISTTRRSYLRQNIAYINQNTSLFDRPIMENILYGCNPSVQPKHVYTFLKENQLDTLFHKMNLSLDRQVGRGGNNLSGGMRQIVLLMRCHFQDAPIVILDEVTSNIDSRHRRHAIQIVRRMLLNKTVIAVSHDADMMDIFHTHLIFSSDGSPTLEKVMG